MKKIVWVTAEYFVETDIHVMPMLLEWYDVEWYVVYYRKKEDLIYEAEIQDLARRYQNLHVHITCLMASKIYSIEAVKETCKLLKLVSSHRGKAVYSTILNYPYIPLSILYLKRRNTIFAAHNVHVPKGVSHPFMTKMYQGFAMRWYKNYQTFSKSQYDLLKDTYKGKNVFYAPFVLKDYGKQKTKPEEGVVTFLNFGRIRGYKCIDVLIRAAEKVYNQTQKIFKVIIAGECDNWSDYQKYIIHTELFELHIENIPNEQIPDIFGKAHYTVLPYQDIAQSGALMVCVNYGKPSILSKLPAFEEILSDGVDAYFIEPANEQQLAERMLHCIEHHDEIYPGLVSNLETMKIEQFSKDAIAKKYIEFIDKF
jgi:glycosyltransferase involved in cell wall biosynthesis